MEEKELNVDNFVVCSRLEYIHRKHWWEDKYDEWATECLFSSLVNKITKAVIAEYAPQIAKDGKIDYSRHVEGNIYKRPLKDFDRTIEKLTKEKMIELFYEFVKGRYEQSAAGNLRYQAREIMKKQQEQRKAIIQ